MSKFLDIDARVLHKCFEYYLPYELIRFMFFTIIS